MRDERGEPTRSGWDRGAGGVASNSKQRMEGIANSEKARWPDAELVELVEFVAKKNARDCLSLSARVGCCVTGVCDV